MTNKRFINSMVVAAGLSMVATSALPFAEQTDRTEMVQIAPNHSVFWVPSVGDTATNQSEYDSEAFFNKKKIAARLFEIPHHKLQGSNGKGVFSGADYFVPDGRLFIVNRSPITREWVAGKKGTSTADESFPCQSKEGINIRAGVSIGISVTEQQAARYLYNFGVQQTKESESVKFVEDKDNIFQSVYFGRSLDDVADRVVHKRVQTLVCNEIGLRTFDKANEEMIPMMKIIETAVKDYLEADGIRLDFIGFADTFGFDQQIQNVINNYYEANKLAPMLNTMQAIAALRVQEGMGAGLASHGLPMVVTPQMLETLGNLVPHVAQLVAPLAAPVAPLPVK
jgi:hypothetical protein